MEIKNLAAAFIAAQKEMGNASKGSKNPFFKSKYADLNSVREACLPALNENGIAVLQPIVQVDGKNFVKTVLLHESGETMESLTEIIFNKANDAQAQGSGITYARRYGLQSLVNIGAEDDDGNQAVKNASHKKLGNIVDDEETKKMKEKERGRKAEVKANEFFSKIKEDVEEAGSIAEIEGVLEENEEKVKRLEDNYRGLYDLLMSSVKLMKEEFGE